MRPPLPRDELERLAALRAHEILDTLPEPAFDRITALTARIFHAPSAALSLVDEHRQWFKSRTGIGLCETSRDGGFCAHTILSDEGLVVAEPRDDARFADHPMVREGALAFYAGAPVRSASGHRIGALWFSDDRSRPSLTGDELATLHDLAALVSSELELRQASRRIARAQERVVIADRLSAVGRLAAGVAHEVNNPLTIILGNLEQATNRLAAMPENPALRETVAALREITSAAHRVRDTVKSLQVFARGESQASTAVDLVAAFEIALAAAVSELDGRCLVTKSFRVAPTIRGAGSKVGQLALNLLFHAVDALRGRRGALSLEVFRDDGSADAIVEVHHDGEAPAPEYLARLFEPFAPTGATSIGSLGLFVARRLAEDLGGALSASAPDGGGVTLRLRLPTAPEEEPAATVERAPRESRRGRVLVIDDEAPIRTLVQRLLAPKHDVTLANGGVEGLHLIRSSPEFDLIVCDLTMPEMHGSTLYRTLERERPDAARRLVFLSGGAIGSESEELIERAKITLLTKPIAGRTFAAEIDDLVARCSERRPSH